MEHESKREIRFRAWHLGKMQYDVWPTGATKFGVWAAKTNPDGSIKEYVFCEMGASGAVLMQYTGLKDRNGREIYEGDILIKKGLDYESEEVQHYIDTEGAPEPEHIEIARDVCTLEAFRFWLKNERFGYEGEDLESPSGWEVIGNIYDHPTLK